MLIHGMTLATKVTIARICLIPVFAGFAISYGISAAAGMPQEHYRWTALSIFTIAAVSDGLDGWIARRFHQISRLGALLDPIADKLLVLTALAILTVYPWGPNNWKIPLWFTCLVIIRDCIILLGIRILQETRSTVPIQPHWTGKACTFSLFMVLAWVMLKAIPISPVYIAGVATLFLLWSLCAYIRQGVVLLKKPST